MILKDKIILIMGLRNKWSISFGVAKKAYENGAKVIYTYNKEEPEKMEKLTEEIPGAKGYKCDVSSDESIEECLSKIKEDYGKIDGILHSIAHANTEDLRNDFIYTSREGYLHSVDVSSYSLVAICKYAIQKELLNDNGSVIALSYYGAEKAVQGYNVMGAAKAALEASVRYLARDLGVRGIRVNAISAGPIKTLSAKGIKDFSSILDVVEERAPLHRNVNIEDVGNVSAFLFSDMSNSITGETIHVDAGFSSVGV